MKLTRIAALGATVLGLLAVPFSGPAAMASTASSPATPVPVKVICPPAGGRVLTEVHGPRLRAHEVIYYRGGIYTVASARGNWFTLDYRGKPFVNHGAAIRDGRALVLRGGVVITWRPAPRK